MLSLAFVILSFVNPVPNFHDTAPPSYSSDEVAWAKGFGPNLIDGIANRTVLGTSETCAGEEVLLRPRSKLSDYKTQMIFRNLRRGRVPIAHYLQAASMKDMPGGIPKGYDTDVRRARCSIDGKFLLTGLPDGEYYAVVITYPRKYLGKVTPIETIQVVMAAVSVSGGGTYSVDLLPENH